MIKQPIEEGPPACKLSPRFGDQADAISYELPGRGFVMIEDNEAQVAATWSTDHGARDTYRRTNNLMGDDPEISISGFIAEGRGFQRQVGVDLVGKFATKNALKGVSYWRIDYKNGVYVAWRKNSKHNDAIVEVGVPNIEDAQPFVKATAIREISVRRKLLFTNSD